jgi:hypothetical protein
MTWIDAADDGRAHLRWWTEARLVHAQVLATESACVAAQVRILLGVREEIRGTLHPIHLLLPLLETLLVQKRCLA